MTIRAPKDLSVNTIPEFLRACAKIFTLVGKLESGYIIDLAFTKKASLLGVLVFYKIIEFSYVNNCFYVPYVALSKEMDLAIEKYGFTNIIKRFIAGGINVSIYENLQIVVEDTFIIAPQALLRDDDFSEKALQRNFLPLIEKYYSSNHKGVKMIFQCLSEVLLNFWEHAIEDTQSIIVASGNRNQIEIACADNGKGVVSTLTASQDFKNIRPENIVMKAIEKGITSKRQTDHMGYGLWLLNEIVTLVRGRLHLYSEGAVYRNDFGRIKSESCGYWGGTIIYITLPLQNPKTLADIPEYQEKQIFDDLQINFG